VVGTEDGKIVGFMGTLPVKFKVFGEVIEAVWPMDMMASPNAKNSMWGAKMARNLCSLSDCCVGTPNNNSFPISRRVGYTLVAEIPTHINIIRPSSFVDGAIKFPLKPLDMILKASSMLTRPRTKNIEIEKHTSFGNWANELFEKVSCQFNIISIKNKELLNWRFFKSPFKYHLFVARNKNEVSGYLVARIKEGKIKRGLIVDFLASKSDHQTTRALLREAQYFFLSNNVDAISSIMFPFPELEKNLKRFGFLFQKRTQKLIAYSSKYIEKLKDKNNWYLTQFDSDLDMR
jgi:hypothetical protein